MFRDNFDLEDKWGEEEEEFERPHLKKIGGVHILIKNKTRQTYFDLLEAINNIANTLDLDITKVTLPSYYDYSLIGDRISEIQTFTFVIRSKEKIDCWLSKLRPLEKYHLCFVECRIGEVLQNCNLRDYQGNLHFNKCIFEEKFNLSNIEFKNLNLENCEFHQDFLLQNSKVENLGIYDNTFKQAFYFSDNKISLSEFFHHNVFCDKTMFNETHFQAEVNFGESVFKKYTDFSDTTFGTPFLETNSTNLIRFDKCIFQEGASFARSKFYGEVTSFYEAKFERIPSFSQAIFRSNLNFVNTSLRFDYDDVSQTISSQAKEKNISLSSIANDFRDSFRLFKNALSKEGNIIDASNHHRIELYCKEIELDSKPQKSWQDRIDSLQLWFYRLTSDHHTDLLRIISWVITTIGCFGLGLFACRYGLDFHSFVTNHSHNAFATLFDTPLMTQGKTMELVYLFGVCSLFWQWSRILFFSSITLSMILVSYKNIFGINTLLNANISQNPLENLIVALYLLLMFLLLFSLQKTARKNSIIPS